MRPPVPAFALALCLFSTLVPAVPAAADPVDTDTARAQLFRADRVEVARYDTPGLSDDEVATLTTIAQQQKYYAALAFAPDAGIMAEPTVLAANFHSIDAAREAALRDCNARRSGGARCTIALEVRPAGWEPRDLSLSADATQAFNDSYRRAQGERAFAASASTGQFGVARGDGAADLAVSACAGETNVSDCAVVIAD